MELSNAIKNEYEYMLGIRRYLHKHPELSNKETQTSAFIRAELSKLPGVELTDIGWELGALALIRGKLPGRTVMLRADIDALPMDEESGLEFSSENPGVCHSCGHDLHTASLMGLAKYLSERADEIPGNVWLVFQPAEETLDGARKMIELGCLTNDPKPEAIYSVHCDPMYPAGKYAVLCGSSNSSCDKLRLTVRSEGGHGARSHQCCDTILTMAELLVTLKNVVAHDNNFMLPATLTFGHIEGGATCNVIPKEVHTEGTLRTIYPESRDLIKESIRRTCEGMAKTMNGKIELEFIGEGVPSINNDKVLYEKTLALIGSDCEIMRMPTSGSEDFALYQEKIPGLHIRVGTNCEADPATRYSLHNAKIHFEERAMLYALALFEKIIFCN